MKDNTNIALLITEFLAVGGFIYWVLGLFNILTLNWMRLVLAIMITLIIGLIIKNKKSNEDKIDSNQRTVENPNQSTTGRLASGYIKTIGYTNIIGIILFFILGGFMVLGGIVLALLFSSYFVFLIFSGIGAVIIIFAWFGLKHSKKMREEGKYYQFGKGMVKPK